MALCISAPLAAIARRSSFGNSSLPKFKAGREATINELEKALASAKAGELRSAELEVALAATVRRSDVIAKRVVGLEVELEGAVRILEQLEDDTEEVESAADSLVTSNLWRALHDLEEALVSADVKTVEPLCGPLMDVWRALPDVDERVRKLEANLLHTRKLAATPPNSQAENGGKWSPLLVPWAFACFVRSD